MNKLFVDTNAFVKMGYNFDEQNPIISVIIKNIIDKKYKYYNLSVIDNEIASHLETRFLEDFEKAKKIKWINNYITDDVIKENCLEKIAAYKKFKQNIGAIECNVENINPEKILEKYFKKELPFEDKKDKRKEFPDAFIAEYLNNIRIENEEKIYFVTNDNGLKKSLNSNVMVFSDLESFLSSINSISPREYKKIEGFIVDSISSIEEKIFQNKKIEINNLEQESISVDKIKIQKIIDIQVIDKNENSYIINCKCDFLILEGEFACLDYNNSCFMKSNDYYFSPEYIVLKEMALNDFEFIIKINYNEDDELFISYFDEYKININYESIEKCYSDIYLDYDGEDSWSQDGGPYR